MNKIIIATALSCFVTAGLSASSQSLPLHTIKNKPLSVAKNLDPPVPECWPHCKPAGTVAIAANLSDPPVPECWPHCKPAGSVAIAANLSDPPVPECWPHCKPAGSVSIAANLSDPPVPECWPHCVPAARYDRVIGTVREYFLIPTSVAFLRTMDINTQI